MVSLTSLKILPSVAMPDSQNPARDTFLAGINPFIMCMKIVGLYQLDWETDKCKKVRRYMATGYRWFVPSILMANFLFSLGEFMHVKEFDAILLNNLISSIWFLQVVCFSVNNTIRSARWDQLYTVWDAYAEKNKVDTRRTVRKLAIACTCGYIFWMLAAVSFMVVGTISPKPPSGFMLYIPPNIAVLFMILIIMAYCYFVSTWFLLTAQFTLIGVSICRLLHKFYKSVKRSLGSCEFISDRIEGVRQQHEKICLMIELSDNIICVFVMVTVFTTIPLIVLTLYFVLFINTDNANFSYIATWWSISLSTLQLSVVFILGGAVNYMVHRPLGLLYQLKLEHASSDNVLQLGVFLNRLTTQPIGFTAIGLFVLDKPTIMTFVGSIATYALVMIQFKPSDTTQSFTCNCSSVM